MEINLEIHDQPKSHLAKILKTEQTKRNKNKQKQTKTKRKKKNGSIP